MILRPGHAFALCLLLPAVAGPLAAAEGRLSFNRDIRPILSENCFACHGFDAKKREADLRLDTAEGAAMDLGGYQAIVPGNLEKSEAWERILSTDPDEIMPPPKSHKTLTDAQKNTLKRWIEEGAVYERHWSLETPVKPAVPAEGRPIDHFLAAPLAAKRLTARPEADRATLIRRVAFTLTGLPPTLAEVDAFEKDASPGAYETMVDRYLQSPRYGEEMARHWLDVARYGDTHGLHLDNERHMWAYRDWVVKAFNENLSFDQFTTWQLAGDLLPNATTDQLVATGFSRCNVTTSEGGAIDEEYRHLYAIDRAATVTTAWLGVTGGCAQCHDHKYDPMTAKDFYSLYAFFYSAADPAMDGNIAKTAPILKLPAPGQQEALDAALMEQSTSFAELEATALPAYTEPDAKAAPVAREQVIFDDLFSLGTVQRNTSRNAPVWIDRPDFGAPSGRRVLEQANGQFFEHLLTPELIPVTVPEKNARFEIAVRPDPLSPPQAISIVLNGKRVYWGDPAAFEVYNAGSPAKVVSMGAMPEPGKWTTLSFDPAVLEIGPGSRLNSIAVQMVGGRVSWDRFVVKGELIPAKDPLASFALWWQSHGKKAPSDLPGALVKSLTDGPDKTTDAKAREALLAFYLRRIAHPSEGSLAAPRAAWEAARVAVAAADEAIPTTLIFNDLPEPRETFIAERGQYNKPGEKVEPAIPASFGPFTAPKEPRRLNRLDLAQWLVAPQHPLTARVTVNRFWQQVFGTGLVKTSHDLGSQGEPPTHPELIDWLAVSFVERGWDVKWLMKELLMSRAFRQSYHADETTLAVDPENRFLARAPRIRLDAEQIRDNALSVSGLLNLTMGGRGTRTYQPPNIWEPVGYGDSNTRCYLQDHGDALYRRSLYIFFKRTAPPPFMTNFDAPNREQSCTRRERNNTPMQALQLLNDVQHFEAARALAERVLTEGGKDDTARLRWLFRTVLSRMPDEKETGLLTDALAQQRYHAGADAKAAEAVVGAGESVPKQVAPATETAAWTMVANLVLNLDETVTRN
jgi:mono/diheme cytochrome c family protein